MSIEKIESAIGLPKGTTDGILQEIRANTAKLDACAVPHDFKQDDNPNPFRKKWVCQKCGGSVDLPRGAWYLKGLEHGRAQ